jgi:hypothetical protein
MSAANPLWGAPRFHGELCKIGIDVSERTGLALPASAPHSATPKGGERFLANHVEALVSMAFFTVQTVTGRALVIFVVLAAGESSTPRLPSIRLLP